MFIFTFEIPNTIAMSCFWMYASRNNFENNSVRPSLTGRQGFSKMKGFSLNWPAPEVPKFVQFSLNWPAQQTRKSEICG